MRRTIMFLTLAVFLLALPLVAGAGTVFPDVIPLAVGLTPEGITEGTGTTFYYGTLTGGNIFRGDFRTGEIELLVDPDPDRIAVGLSFDQRSNLLFVGSAFMGVAYVYDVTDGSEVATIPLTTPFAGFINEATVTRDAVYFTDSIQAAIYRVTLNTNGSLPDPVHVEEIELEGEFVLVPQPQPPDPNIVINANGVVATPNGRWLLIVNSTTGDLYRVDPQTGYAKLIDLGGAKVLAGDGLVLRGHTLYVVQNALNQIREVALDPDMTTGTIVDEVLTSDAFRVPTTAAVFGNALYSVNARFGEFPDPFNPPPGAEFEAVRVEIKP